MDPLFVARADVDNGVKILIKMGESRLQHLMNSPDCYHVNCRHEFCNRHDCDVCCEIRNLVAAVVSLREHYNCD